MPVSGALWFPGPRPMKRYEKALRLIAIMISIPSGFQLVVGMVTANASFLYFWGGLLTLWWGAYLAVRHELRYSLWASLVLVNLCWWPLLAATVMRLVFVIENAGLESADGGSPGSFLVGLVFEQLLFIPLSLALYAGVTMIVRPATSSSA